jgi:hypothetical protein
MEGTVKDGGVDLLKSYTAVVLSKKNLSHLREIALQGKAGELKLRTFCWRVFLGIIPITDDRKVWVKSVRRSREEFALHKESLNAFKKTNLDPNKYNPLMKSTPVPSPSTR